jgi:outer membrane protein
MVDVPLALPFKHDTVGAGAIAGVGKLGEVKVIAHHRGPAVPLSAGRRPMAPLSGAGPDLCQVLQGTRHRRADGPDGWNPGRPTLLQAESRFGLTAQIGVAVALNERWSLDLACYKTFVKTRNTLSTGQHIDVKLNPNVFTVGLAYRF